MTGTNAAIFDVDGVLLSSSHERARREALDGFGDASQLTTAMYRTFVAGKPRLVGARAALEQLGVVDADKKAPIYADRKQGRLEDLIAFGKHLRLSGRPALCPAADRIASETHPTATTSGGGCGRLLGMGAGRRNPQAPESSQLLRAGFAFERRPPCMR